MLEVFVVLIGIAVLAWSVFVLSVFIQSEDEKYQKLIADTKRLIEEIEQLQRARKKRAILDCPKGAET